MVWWHPCGLDDWYALLPNWPTCRIRLRPQFGCLPANHPQRQAAIWIERYRKERGEYYSSWVLMSRESKMLEQITAEGVATDWDRDEPRPILWSDDYSNLFKVIKWD